MKKTLSLIMLAMLMATGAMAQKMVVKTTDQQTVMFDIPNVESVSFVDGYVDLGLPSGTLWATCNVGASSPEEYGDFFAWGETEPKSEYAWTNYFDTDDNGGTFNTYYKNGSLTALLAEHDAATANWGEGWQMPSKEQFEELIDPSNTTTIWLEQKGVYGRMIIGKNSQYIFLPAAGFRWGTSYNGAGSDGYYWSRTLNASSGLAEGLLFGSGSISGLSSGRGMGFSVRPVVCGANQIQKIPVTGIVLNYSTLSLQPDATQQLTATVLPEDASNKAVTWNSSNTAVATVSTGGLVTAKTLGTCTITCSAKDGSGVKAECQVTVTEAGGGGTSFNSCPDGNHPHLIDLGLLSGTKWACCNVGANKPEGYGGYYAWGETKEKNVYDWSTYFDTKDYGKTFVKYGPVGSWSVIQPEDDAAAVNWGYNWEIPDYDQQEELIKNCSKKWTLLNGVNGLLLTGNNGNQIFLPAAGYRDKDGLNEVGESGYYWSSRLGFEEDNTQKASVIEFDSNYWAFDDEGNYRYIGQSVRAVRK